MPAARGLRDQPLQVGEGRLRGERGVVVAAAAAPTSWRSSSSACRPASCTLPGQLADPVRVVGGHLDRAGLQHHQAHPVADDVVHLPGDPGPLGRAPPRGPAAALAPRPARPGRPARRPARPGCAPRRRAPPAAPAGSRPAATLLSPSLNEVELPGRPTATDAGEAQRDPAQPADRVVAADRVRGDGIATDTSPRTSAVEHGAERQQRQRPRRRTRTPAAASRPTPDRAVRPCRRPVRDSRRR